MSSKKIALFGGSFDPIHTDHLNIAIAAHEKLGFDEVWIIPTYLSPFKKQHNSSVEHRLGMLKILADKYSWLKINDYEITKAKSSYTYDTVNYLINLKENQDFAFSFIIGSDLLDNLEKWNKFSKLVQLIDFKVFKRSEVINEQVVQKYKFPVYEFNRVGLSSTMIRNLEKLELQIPEVNDYINNNLLYLDERVKQHMDKSRFIHSLNVGKMSVELAKKHGLDEQKALIAGTLHDIAKQWSEDKMYSYLEKWAPELLTEPKVVWHSYVGGLHLKHDWLIKDSEIIGAVFNHTSGTSKMSLFEKLIFCADKISIERNYDKVGEYRQLCLTDLNQGFKALLKNQYDQAIAKNGIGQIGKNLQKTYEYYLVEGNE